MLIAHRAEAAMKGYRIRRASAAKPVNELFGAAAEKQSNTSIAATTVGNLHASMSPVAWNPTGTAV
ncbi:hypothetical protein [Nocardiopsis sp. CA-288880]|uniref:hypothetical protein n=1 Tax=Nocardiopsis sp. CA-288880 TaxID=3239995 RepID=UPI003D98A2B2